MLRPVSVLAAATLLLIFVAAAFGQGKRAIFYVVWDNGGERVSSTESSGRDWASRRLGLELHDRPVPPGVVVHGPQRLVQPYAHVNGAVQLFGEMNPLEFSTVRFREVKDEPEYLLRIDEILSGYDAKARHLPGTEIAVHGPPERRRIIATRNWLKPETIDTVRIIRGTKVTAHRYVKDAHGQRQKIPTTATETHFVRRDGKVMLEGLSPAVFELPITTVTRPARFREDDRTYLINVDQIPRRMREALWEQRASVGEARLQQRDEEGDLTYAERRAWKEIVLDLERAVYFDLDTAWASLQFREESKPIRASAEISTLSDTELGRGLKRLGPVSTRLYSVDSKDEVAFLHAACRIPQRARTAAQATFELYRQHFSAQYLTDLAEQTVEDGVFELLLSIRAESTHGLAAIGAIRTSAEFELSDRDLFASLSAAPNLKAKRIHGFAERAFVRISLDFVRDWKSAHWPEWEFVEIPEYAFLCHEPQALWFSLGGENAWRVLEAELNDQKRDPHVSHSKRHMLECRVNLELAIGNEEQQSVLSSHLRQFEQAYVQWFATRMLHVTGFGEQLKVPEPDAINAKYIFEQAFTGQPSRAELTLDHVGNGLRAELTADHSLALCYFARRALNFRDAMRARTMAISGSHKP